MKQKSFPEELIGEEITIVDSSNKSNVGLHGKIVDETKSTIKVVQGGRTLTVLKNTITFRIERTKKVIVGNTIIKRPEERLKG
jgi:ribonuclease P protein subunit POP4